MAAKNQSPEDWPFDDTPNVAVFTTTHVVRARKPILYVSHDADDGSWQFHSGDAVSTKGAMVVALAEIVKIDPSIAGLANLPVGWCATRKTQDSAWKFSKEEE
jgi:hypothetical protein